MAFLLRASPHKRALCNSSEGLVNWQTLIESVHYFSFIAKICLAAITDGSEFIDVTKLGKHAFNWQVVLLPGGFVDNAGDLKRFIF